MPANHQTRRVSFIIPAKNEENEIGDTLNSILTSNFDLDYEVIVVDHNSTDQTAAISQKMGAKVFTKHGGNISSVRNFGANAAFGDVFIFLDADVSITTEWTENFPKIADTIQKNSYYMTGSHCRTPGNRNWLDKYWFSKFSQAETTNHIGSGHMIISRELFMELGGFDETLETGEDYDICIRAKKAGATLKNDIHLKVIHRDYPKTLLELIKREAWHGVGDAKNLKTIVKSKVALSAIAFICMHLILIITTLAGSVFGSLIALNAIFLLLLLSSIYKFKHNGITIVTINAVVFYFYYIGRSLSFLKRAKLTIR
jgi:glycosyltransferase involved in cell wall biosynthesis